MKVKFEDKNKVCVLKGALVRVPVKGGGPLEPIYFQFNPEKIERTKSGTWTTAQSLRQKAEEVTNKKKFKKLKKKKIKAGFMPSPEKINLTLYFDSAEKAHRAPSSKSVYISEGILPELSALESLMEKVRTKVSVGGSPGSPTLKSPKKIPLVLFVWGQRRIIPVTLLSMTITEQKYDSKLNPVRAEVRVTLQVLEKEDAKLNDKASSAYGVTEKEKKRMKKIFLKKQGKVKQGIPVKL